MTINLTISAESAKDFFTHLAEVAAGFVVREACPVMPEVAASMTASAAVEAAEEKPKRGRRTNAQIAVDNAAQAANNAAQQAAAGNAENQIAADTAEETGSPTETVEEQGEETAAPSAAQPSSASDTRDIDYDRDVVPLVLAKVREKGKPWVAGVMEAFGIAKASELDPSLYGELIDALNGE